MILITMDEPFVSVVIATYRREESLIKALQSLAIQVYKNFEIVLVDDNDSLEWNERVRAIIDGFRKDNPEIKLLNIENHPNLGSAKARNKGIEYSGGEYITFLDDDDLYLPNKLDTQLKKMQEVNADYSLTDLLLYGEDETLCEVKTRDYLSTEEASDLLLCHLKYHMTGTDTMMFRTEYIKAIGGFEPIDVGDEFYLMMKAINYGGKFVYCKSCDVKAYVHTGEGGLSSGKGKIEGENRLYNFKKQYFRELTNKDKKYIKMRHFAVLAYAYKRAGKIFHFFINGVKAFLVSPRWSIYLLKNHKGQE